MVELKKNIGKIKELKDVSTAWLLMLAAGLVLILVGTYALFEPWNTFIYLVKYTGIALMVSSILLIVFAITTSSSTGEIKWLVLESMIDLAFAIILVFNPFLTVIAFPFLIGWWILLRGLVKIILSLSTGRLLRARMVVLIIGILSVVFGLLMINFPFDRSKGISTTISIFCLIMGSLYVYDAIRYKKREYIIISVI